MSEWKPKVSIKEMDKQGTEFLDEALLPGGNDHLAIVAAAVENTANICERLDRLIELQETSNAIHTR